MPKDNKVLSVENRIQRTALNSNIKEQKNHHPKQNELKKRVKDYEYIIYNSLKERNGSRESPATERVIEVLRLAKDRGLYEFMKKTNYFVFDWSIEHEHLELIDTLLETMRPETHFLMVSKNDYATLKGFVERSLKLSYSEYKASSQVKRKILAKLIAIDPTEIQPIIQKHTETLKDSTPVDVYTAFKQELESMEKNNMETKNSDSLSSFFKKNNQRVARRNSPNHLTTYFSIK